MTSEAKRAVKLNVRLEAVLFATDAPDIALLTRKQGAGLQHYIACSIPDDNGYVDYYFVVFVGRAHLIKYFDEQCDLRFLFTYAGGRRFFTVKNLPSSKENTVQLVEFLGDVTEELLPDSRFFASSHTSPYGMSDIARAEQKLLIDGNWDMQEFGSFYQKFSDLYSYELAVKYVEDANSPRKNRVESAFRSKPFRGGSSYVGFFDDLFDIIPRGERPALQGIEYHSPGYVELGGSDEILDSVRDSIEGFLVHYLEIQAAHDALKSFMSKSKLLLVTGSAPLPGPEVLNQLRILSENFFRVLPINGKDHLRVLTNGNIVVHAKVGLALFRRLRSTAQFFAQGRLSFT